MIPCVACSDFESIRFLLVGGLNTLFSYAVYAFFLLYVGVPYALANLLAILIGIAFSFRTQGTLVFLNPDLRLIVRFVACWLVIWGLNVGLIALLMRFGLDAYVAGGLAFVPMIPMAYLMQKFLVFRPIARRADTRTADSRAHPFSK